MRWLRAILLVLVLQVAACLAHAYIYCQVGVDSNLLIDGNRVVFAQSDGSLTVLEIETGQVLRRVKGRDFSGTLRRVPQGILVLNYGTIAMLNSANLTVTWETTTHYDPTVLNGVLVSYDGNGLVQSRDLRTGKILWSFELSGALDVIAESGKVLVHRAATYEDNLVPTTVMLDLDSGKELFRKIPPPRTHWKDVFFDGEKIYLTQGPFDGKRSDYRIEQLIVWNSSGEEIAAIPVSSILGNEIRGGDAPFNIDGKTFYDRQVYSSREAIPSERFGRLVSPKNPTNEIHEAAYALDDDFTFVQRENHQSDSKQPITEIQVWSSQGKWTGTLPYLSDAGRIAAIARASGKLLIGSNLGHVECVNIATGESLWLYVFPTIRQTMSFSSPNGMPPMMSQAAMIFRKENEPAPTSGVKLAGQVAKPTRVVFDPDPTNPFKKLPLLLAVTWGSAILPVLAVIFLRLNRHTRKWNLGFVSILVAALVFGCFMHYGRVSPGSSLALRAAILTFLVVGIIDALKYIRRGKRLLGSMVICALAVVAWVILPFLIRI